MKKAILLSFIIFKYFFTFAQLPTSGLVAWYPFCGNTNDYSGNGHHMVNTAATLTTDRYAYNNTAYEYNGVNSMITYSTFFPVTTDLTYACWINPYSNQISSILYNGNSNTDGFGLVFNSGGWPVLPGNKACVLLGGVVSLLPTTIPLHQWHHLVLIKRATTFELIVDTVSVGTFARTPNPTTNIFHLGIDNTNGTNPFDGKIDDAVVYNRALTNLEIRQLYHYNPDQAPFSLGNDTSICSSSIVLTPSPAYPGITYAWSTGATTSSVSASPTGTYWLNIINTNGCQANDTINITAGGISVNLGADTSFCSGSLTLSSPSTPPGSSYSWSTGSTATSIVVLTSGAYWVRVSNGICTAVDTIRVTTGSISVNIGADTSFCIGASITLSSPTTTTGASYVWSTGSTATSIAVSTPGTYWLRVTSGPCTAIDTIHISSSSELADIGRDTTFCKGASVTLSSPSTAPGASYMWSTGATSTSITASASGTYWLRVSNGICITVDTVRITVISVPVDLGVDTGFCIGGSIALSSPSTPSVASCIWSTGATSSSIATSAAGTFWLRASIGSCITTDTVHISVTPIPVVDLGNDTIVCAGTYLVIRSKYTYSEKTTYEWSSGEKTPFISPTTSGLYTLKVSKNGCFAYGSINVFFKPGPPVSLGNDKTICTGSPVVLSSTSVAGAVYSWSTGATSNEITVSTPGTYMLTVTKDGCSTTDTIKVIGNPVPDFDLPKDTILCVGKTITLQPSKTTGSMSYVWSTGATTESITVSATGMYRLTIFLKGCSASDSTRVFVRELPTIPLPKDTVFCSGTEIRIGVPADDNTTYLWDNGSTSSTIIVQERGTYMLKVTQNGCASSAVVNVEKVNKPTTSFTTDTVLCTGKTLVLSLNTSKHDKITWFDGSTGIDVQIRAAGTYWMSQSNICGTIKDSIEVAFIDCNITFPSAFTPNGDGHNDIMRAIGTLDKFKDYNYHIYNRFGQEVFTTTDIYKGWNGIFNGNPQDVGVYFYYAQYTLDGEAGMSKGDFTLIR